MTMTVTVTMTMTVTVNMTVQVSEQVVGGLGVSGIQVQYSRVRG